jgi:hypothetical protein
MNSQQRAPHQPTEESGFLALMAKRPPVVNGIRVLKIGRFRPGSIGSYASAYAIGEREDAPFGPERRFSTHELVWDEDRQRWYLTGGHYDLSWDEAVVDLRRG